MRLFLALVFGALLLVPKVAFAQAAASGVTLDLTGVIVAIVGGVFSIIAIFATYILNKSVSDAKARAVLAAAITNSLGAGQQAAEGLVINLSPRVVIPGVPAKIQPMLQYALDHAGPEATQLGITPLALAGKIVAQVGLTNIAANVAIAQATGAAVQAQIAPGNMPPTSPLLGPVPIVPLVVK